MFKRVASVAIRNAGTVSLLLMLAASLSLNVWLGRAAIARTRPSPGIGRIEIGTKLPPLGLTALDGTTSTFTSDPSRPTLFYVLSPSCGWCKRNHSSVVALSKAIGTKYRFIGLSSSGTLDELREYAAGAPMPFDVFLVDRSKTGDIAILDATPTTLLVNSEGMIERAWMGAYTDEQRPLIESALGVTLPRLPDATASTVAPAGAEPLARPVVPRQFD